MTTTLTSFAQTAMLVSVNVRSYSAKKEDKKVSRKVAADNATTTDAGAYQKHLVSKESLAAVTTAIGAMRTFHYENTQPWLDEGIRCLPAANYESYKTGFEPLRDQFETAVRDFCNRWPEIVEAAEKQLNGLFNAADYPADIASRFGVTVRFMPLTDASDFRVNISEGERELLRQQIQGTLDAAAATAMGDLYRRLSDGVKAMAERLRAYGVDATTGKPTGVFRDSLVENLRDLVALIPRLNFTEDRELEAIRRMVSDELCAADAETLRDDTTTRTAVADSADAIAKRLGEFMAP